MLWPPLFTAITVSTDAVGHLLAAASRFPIPSKSEQLILGAAIQTGLQADATPGQRRAGERARRRLVEGNLRLAISMAKPYARRLQSGSGMGFSDLIQESCIGLNLAALKFDPTRGYSFTTMATWWCKQAVGRAIQMQNKTIRQPITTQEIQRRWRYRPEGQPLEQFCDAWGYSTAQVRRELEHGARGTCASLDAAVSSADDAGCLLDVIADTSSQGQHSFDALDLEIAVARLEAAGAPEDLELVRASLINTTPALAAQMGCDRSTMASRLKGARQRLAAVAGDQARELLVA